MTLDTRVDSTNEDDGSSSDDAGSSNEGNKENPEIEHLLKVKKAHAALDEVFQDLKGTRHSRPVHVGGFRSEL